VIPLPAVSSQSSVQLPDAKPQAVTRPQPPGS
jgi:hypothetical protein